MNDGSEFRGVTLDLVADGRHYDQVIRAVLEARLSVWIATANLKELMVEAGGRRRYRSILESFDGLARRGVELRLLHAAKPSRAFSQRIGKLPRLVGGGLALRQCPRVHFKTVVVDAERLYLGSANWTGAGLGAKGEDRRNFELGLLLSDELLIDAVQAYFERIWSGGACPSCRLRELCEAPLDTKFGAGPRLP